VRMKQKGKQILPVLLIIGVTVFMSLLLYSRVMRREKADCWQLLQGSAQSVTHEMGIVFENNLSFLRLAANTMTDGEGDPEEQFQSLNLEVFQEQTLFSRISLICPDGRVLQEDGDIAYLPTVDTFEKLSQAGEHMSPRITNSQTGEQTVCYLIPLIRNGEAAILAGVIPCEAIQEAFRPAIYEGQAVCGLIDSHDGNFIMDQWHDTLGNAFAMQERPRMKGYENIDLKQDTRELKTGVIAFRSQTTGKNLYMYYMPIGMFDWELEVFVPEDVVFESMNYLREQLLLAGAVEVVLVLIYFFWNLHTLSQLAAYQDELQFMSYWDSLTSLYNRNKYIQQQTKYAGRRLTAVGAAFLDLNGLKEINDTQGHDAGDALIRGAAEVIRSIFRQDAYRVGGDEFVILTVGMEEARFREKIERLEKTLAEEQISASLGVIWAESCDELKPLLEQADARMYETKKKYHESSRK